MRLPYFSILACAALSLAGCATAGPLSDGDFPTSLPDSVLVDDKLGTSVELAYQAANLAVRTGLKAGLIGPDEAEALVGYDQRAYEAVCYTRTGYDLANGRNPLARIDACPLATKQNKVVSYATAGRMAVEVIKAMIGATRAAIATK